MPAGRRGWRSEALEHSVTIFVGTIGDGLLIISLQLGIMQRSNESTVSDCPGVHIGANLIWRTVRDDKHLIVFNSVAKAVTCLLFYWALRRRLWKKQQANDRR
ncbi:hypothetical protein EAH79_02505 [Sphingomonas koreensis]|nr:hypothetical protein EAH79_02505 [Sphingomonas koreensis]